MVRSRAAPSASSPLLETKLHRPQRRAGAVSRPRLLERLNRGADSRLTLVSAPAGFGKTTLLAEWIESIPSDERHVAWLSLDAGDNQAATFWTYVLTAVEGAQPGIGAAALALLREDPATPVESVLTALLNKISAASGEVVLVLDDYHLIEARDIHEGVAFLLEHLPPRLHLVIATRADPTLPLARMRGRGELTEVRAADLRFMPEEAAAYLNETMRLALTVADIEALEVRTEGWIAALQMAALSMQGRDDVADFIAGFAGDDRYVVDYLAEEVLQRQPDGVRDFLLRTSILDRLSAPLCDAVTGRADGRLMLERLDRGNLFLVPLDGRRQWYRYHHLFADVLRTRLLDEQPEAVAELHRRACEWYEGNGQRSEAIRHAFAANDPERAADLVELALPELRRARQETIRLQWLKSLPADVIRTRPVLSNEYAGSLLQRGELEGVEAFLRDAERGLEEAQTSLEGGESGGDRVVIADATALRDLPGRIAVHRAGQALMLGDVTGAVEHARRVLDLASEDDHLARGGAAGLLALAHWRDGDLEAAAQRYAQGMASLERAGHLSDVVGLALGLADVRLAQGRLTEALRVCERGLTIALEPGGAARRGAADMHVAMAAILRERNELATANEHLLAAEALGEANGLPQNRYRSLVAAAGVRQAEGDLDKAIELLTDAERVYFGDFSPNVRPVTALRAKLLIAVGRLSEAATWAREAGLSTAGDREYVREFEHITLARLLLAQARRDSSATSLREVLEFLGLLLEDAESGGRGGSVIEILVVQALAFDAANETPVALTALERALVLGAPEGYVRTFIDEGAPLARLLAQATKQPEVAEYAQRLLRATGTAGVETPPSTTTGGALSERELDVLRLLASDLSGPDIARELVVSLNTVRTHTKSIYAKLGVNSRRSAVSRAADLGLLARAPTPGRASGS